MGLGLLSDSVYIDLRKRGADTFATFSSEDSALPAEDFDKWVQRGRYVQHAECLRPPQAPARQHSAFEYVAKRGRRVRKSVIGYIMGDGEYCENTEALRKTEFDALWTRMSLAGATTATTAAKEAMFGCFMSCNGGLVMKMSKEEDVKQKACSEAIHWIPVLFSPPSQNTEQCHFYPSGNEDLKRSACFWGNCIDVTAPHSTIWPSFLKTVKRTIDPLIGKPYDIDETLFDDVLNPTPMHTAMQETYAMHCGGKATVWVSCAEDVTAMRNTLRALFGYNEEISVVEVHVSTEVDYMNVVDALELLLEDWEEGLCRSHARDFLAPYTTVRSDVTVDPGQREERDVEADPQIRQVSVVVSGTAGGNQKDSQSGLLLNVGDESYYLLEYSNYVNSASGAGTTKFFHKSKVELRPVTVEGADGALKAVAGWKGKYRSIKVNGQEYQMTAGRPLARWSAARAKTEMALVASKYDKFATEDENLCHVIQGEVRDAMGIFHDEFAD